MKTKILLFFLLLVVGAGNGFAENTSRDSLLQEIKNARTFAKNWDTIPGSDNDKLLAILTKGPIQVEDSIRYMKKRSFGVLLEQKVYYARHIYYDETNKLFKQEIKFSQKKYNIENYIKNWFIQVGLLVLVCVLTYMLYSERSSTTTSDWIPWYIFLGILIYFSHYLGTLCAIISLIYIFKDKIRESLERFLQKRKEKSKKQKKD